MARGYIRERSPGRFSVEVYVGRDALTGRKRWQYRSATTKADAERICNQLLVETGKGVDGGSDATLAELLDAWLDLGTLEESNLRLARGRKKNHVDVDAIAKVKLWKLRVADVDLFVSRLRKKGLKPATIKRVLGDVSAALATAVRWGWISANPVANATPIELDVADPPSPATADVQALLAAAARDDRELAAFLALDAVLGARRGEMCALRWGAVDLDDGWVEIARAIAHGHGGVYEKATKSRRSRRVRVGPATVEILKAHRISMMERAMRLGCRLVDGAYVFSDEPDCSRPWRPDTTSKRFARLRDDLELGHVQLKQLRNYVASELGDAGVPVGRVSRQLGHSRTSTTQDRYQARFVERDDTSAGILEGLLYGDDAKARADAEIERRSKAMEAGQRFMFGHGDKG